VGGTSCRENSPAEVKTAEIASVASEPLRNSIGELPGGVYQSQAASPIFWQPWARSTLERARVKDRLVFGVIAVPQNPAFLRVLESLGRDEETVATINSDYVPTLIDGDSCREMSILCGDLCAEINVPLNMPLLIWMTCEGNPVAWFPVSDSSPENVIKQFSDSHLMVSQMWKDNPQYVLKNSRLNNDDRRERMEQRKIGKVMSQQPAVDFVRSLRQLNSLYNSYTHGFDEAGSIFPSSALELLAASSVHPGVPEDVRTDCHDITKSLLNELLCSPMFDPLDGGVSIVRRSDSWAFPSFVRDCPSQGRIATTLIEAYRATGDARALQKALGLIAFAENHFRNPAGLFSIGLSKEPDIAQWMWTVEEVKKVLSPEDAAWWIKATGMKDLGNLPSEVDPNRVYFRQNTISLGQSMEEIAAGLSLTPEVFKPRFDAVRVRLLQIRNERLGAESKDNQSHAAATFRMVSAYASAFTATGDETYRSKAITLLTKAREAFAVGVRLRVYPTETPESIGAGRAFHYLLALQSVLDVAAITGEDTWLLWAEDLATTSAELFTGKGFLKECPDDAKFLNLPVTDLLMLFDDSSAGLLSNTESRLIGMGRSLVPSYSELATPLPVYTLKRPTLHTDLLMASLSRHFKVCVTIAPDAPPALKTAVQRLPMRLVHRRTATPEDAVPAASVKVTLPDNSSQIITAPDALAKAVMALSPTK
jgi:uncharacterized protein YyaL (SSP411 family)